MTEIVKGRSGLWHSMKARDKSLSLAEWYARFMQTHTYSEWEQLVLEYIAITQTERQSKPVMKRRSDGNN